MEKFLASDCDIVSQLSELGIYDYIIVGSGIGGGVLSEDLARRKKKVLLIERGDAAFSTHICNTARPDFARGRNDSPEGNETVYNNIKSWVQTSGDSEPYVGGPLYCLGGRSIVWGLWIPRTDDKTLKDHFHPDVAQELKDTWFDEAFNLVTNYSQKSGAYPKGYISTKELDAAIKDLSDAIRDKIALGHMVALGPIATQLNSPAPYRFPQGAYSTVTPLLNRIYARDEHLSVLMDAEVIHLEIEKPSDSADDKYEIFSSS
jgi:choline dehydrogenase-like flavoprotein